jgi:uncharacterized protein (TIRG00374 family)
VSSARLRTIVAVLGVAVGAFFLWLAVRDADLDAVWRALKEADAVDVALAVGAFGVVYGFQSARWRRIAVAPRVALARFYEMTVSGIAVNNVLPGRIGDLLRARWLGIAARMPGGRAFGSVIIDRACDLAVLVAMLVVGIGAVASSEWLLRLAAGGILILVGVSAALLLARIYVRSRARERRRRGLLRRLARDTVEMLAEPVGRRQAATWLGLSLLAWGSWSIAALLIARSLGIELTVPEAVFVSAVLNLGSAVPSSPGFVGTYEWLGVASLGLIGIDTEPALAFTILLHAAWYLPTTVAGGSSLGVRAALGLRRRRTDRATRPAPAEPVSNDAPTS